MRIRIIKPGLLSTIQDMGRYHYLSLAVPISGAMDALSARKANMAVGNDITAAVIELTYADVEFTAETDLLIALSGQGVRLKINNQLISSNKPIFIPVGTTILIAHANSGCRAYLAVAGGWDVPAVLGSKSTFLTAAFGGFKGRKLIVDDILNSNEHLTSTSAAIIKALKGQHITYPNWSIPQFTIPDHKTVRVIPAREFTWFNAGSLINFLSQPYSLTPDCNRMGYNLKGPLLERINKAELISTAVSPGTIQVTETDR